ncbi:hypothetical protein [uncultured Tateyamaria sp.]|uniref:DUF2946 family protein n=1 Tax=uncultured Tateyamaria sp. TaxID=455651 RepID=UPI00260755DC|nr:hypothetical protein [uncultured Tateyamaria sp.]
MLRALLSIALSLVLLITSHSAAMARGAPHAVDQMVICSGTAVTTVYVDADGQPIETPHLCPDCAIHLLTALVPPDIVPIWALVASAKTVHLSSVHGAGATWTYASARAPPFDVIHLS